MMGRRIGAEVFWLACLPADGPVDRADVSDLRVGPSKPYITSHSISEGMQVDEA